MEPILGILIQFAKGQFHMPGETLFEKARDKIERATKHIDYIYRMIENQCPYRYYFETDTIAGQNKTYSETDETVVDEITLRCSDALLNLHTALDLAYADIVLPLVKTDEQKENIKFPFSRTPGKFEIAAKKQYAHKIGDRFLEDLVALRPYAMPRGNELLYFLHEMTTPECYATFILTIDFKEITVEEVRVQIPGFLPNVAGDVTVKMTNKGQDFSWSFPPSSMYDRLVDAAPLSGVVKKEIDIPYDLHFEGRHLGSHMIIVSELNQFVDVTNNVLEVLEAYR